MTSIQSMIEGSPRMKALYDYLKAVASDSDRKWDEYVALAPDLVSATTSARSISSARVPSNSTTTDPTASIAATAPHPFDDFKARYQEALREVREKAASTTLPTTCSTAEGNTGAALPTSTPAAAPTSSTSTSYASIPVPTACVAHEDDDDITLEPPSTCSLSCLHPNSGTLTASQVFNEMPSNNYIDKVLQDVPVATRDVSTKLSFPNVLEAGHNFNAMGTTSSTTTTPTTCSTVCLIGDTGAASTPCHPVAPPYSSMTVSVLAECEWGKGVLDLMVPTTCSTMRQSTIIAIAALTVRVLDVDFTTVADMVDAPFVDIPLVTDLPELASHLGIKMISWDMTRISELYQPCLTTYRSNYNGLLSWFWRLPTSLVASVELKPWPSWELYLLIYMVMWCFENTLAHAAHEAKATISWKLGCFYQPEVLSIQFRAQTTNCSIRKPTDLLGLLHVLFLQLMQPAGVAKPFHMPLTQDPDGVEYIAGCQIIPMEPSESSVHTSYGHLCLDIGLVLLCDKEVRSCNFATSTNYWVQISRPHSIVKLFNHVGSWFSWCWHFLVPFSNFLQYIVHYNLTHGVNPKRMLPCHSWEFFFFVYTVVRPGEKTISWPYLGKLHEN